MDYLLDTNIIIIYSKNKARVRKIGSGVNPLIHSFQSPILKGLQATIHIFDPLPKN